MYENQLKQKLRSLDVYRPVPARRVVLCKDCKHHRKEMQTWGSHPDDYCAVKIFHVSYVDGRRTFKRCESANPDGECEEFERSSTSRDLEIKKENKARLAEAVGFTAFVFGAGSAFATIIYWLCGVFK